MKWEEGRFLREFSTFGIGGPIRYFAKIKTEEEMFEALSFCRKEKIPYLVLGKGSNCLFDDLGFCGAVLLNAIDFCNWDGPLVHVGSGYSFSLLGQKAAKQGLSGLEFAASIPASVGGAIWMNAGALGKECSDSLQSVLFLSFEGIKKEYSKEEMIFGYRSSFFQKMDGVILSARFSLSFHEEARKRQLEMIEKRVKSQPLRELSCGCVFRNPSEKVSAGYLIEKCGLKGVFIGGAKVSEIHANFIVNQGNATSQEVKELIALIQKRVYEEEKVSLETEIRVVGHGISS